MKKDRQKRSFWSKCGDSNSRPPVPEVFGSSLLTTFIYFLVLFGLKTMLSCALVRTVSAQSESVDGQRCGQATIRANKPSRDYSKLIPSGDWTVHPVSCFSSAVSIPYFERLVNHLCSKCKNWCAVDERKRLAEKRRKSILLQPTE